MTRKTYQPASLFIGMTITFLLCCSQTIYSQTKWFPTGSAPDKYKMGIDSTLQYSGQNVATIKSTDAEINGFGTLMQSISAGKYLGKRVRMTGYMKSKDVADWAGFWLRVDQAGSEQSLAFDNMQQRAIKGSTDWTKYEIVLEVPAEASNLAFGALLSGTGQIWFHNPTFEIVDNSVPTTGVTD